MLLALPFFWPNYANFYALLAEKCSLMLDILNSNSVKHDLTINLITMAEYVPSMAAKIAGTLSYECIPTSIQSHAQLCQHGAVPKFEENALYVGGKCSKKLAMLKKILMLLLGTCKTTQPYALNHYISKMFTIGLLL